MNSKISNFYKKFESLTVGGCVFFVILKIVQNVSKCDIVSGIVKIEM